MRISKFMMIFLVCTFTLSVRAGFVDATADWFPGGVMSNANDSVSLVDFNNNGFVDIRNGRFLYRNNGGTNATYLGAAGADYVWGDWNNDGWLDLFFTTVYAVGSGGAIDNSRLWRNNGDWTFTDVTTQVGLPADLGETFGAAWGDVNNDGFLDLVTNDKLFINQGNANKWLKVRLEGDGVAINRAAIGAQVRINIGSQTITRQVEGSSGKGSQNEMTLHFGLGSRTAPVNLEITWPGGSVQTVENVGVCQTVYVPAPATMAVSDASLNPVCERGANAAAQTLTISSSSRVASDYNVVSDATWLSVAPSAGSLVYGSDETITVNYDASLLAAGTYHANIAITTDAVITNTPESVAVTLEVVAKLGDLPVAESFEDYAAGTYLSSMPGWTTLLPEDALVTALTYAPATPPGYPLPEAAHTQVLQADDEVVRTLNSDAGQNVNLDCMVKMYRFDNALPAPLEAASQFLFAQAPDGRLHVWHMHHNGADWTQRWSDLGMPAFEHGAWVRVSARMDYTGNPEDTFFQPRVNGSLCPSPYAFKSPTDLTSPGTWYMCADTPGKGGGGAKKISGIALSGTAALDDLVVTTDQPFAHTGSLTTNGVPFSWFDQWGLARFPGLDYDDDGYDAASEYAAGTDPTDPESNFRIISTWVENGRVYLRFLGNDSGDSAPYVIERQAGGLYGDWTVADPNVPRAQAPDAVNTWSEPLPQSSGASFYRVKAPAVDVP